MATNSTGWTSTFVYVAAKNSDDTDDAIVTVDQVFGDDDDTPATHFATAGNGAHGVLYAMDTNDIYIENGETAAACETIRPSAGTPADGDDPEVPADTVRVVIYYKDADKSSIFDILPPA